MIEGRRDAVLHLLDRQIVDSDGLMVGKVDDLALSPDLRVVGLLCGTAALLPRLGGRVGAKVLDFWQRMGPEQADRSTPYFIPAEAIRHVRSDVKLDRVRLGLMTREEPAGIRLSSLLGLPVRHGDRTLGRVIDVRLVDDEVEGIVVGRGGPGSLLGYERRRDQGPWLVGTLIRAWHRNTGYVGRADVTAFEPDHELRVSVDRLAELRSPT